MNLRVSGRCQQNGFTTIELLVVLLIIGILASIILPRYSSVSMRAVNNTNLSTARTIYTVATTTEVTSPGSYYSIPQLVSNGFLESNPGSGFSISYSAIGIQVTYPNKPSGTKTYPD